MCVLLIFPVDGHVFQFGCGEAGSPDDPSSPYDPETRVRTGSPNDPRAPHNAVRLQCIGPPDYARAPHDSGSPDDPRSRGKLQRNTARDIVDRRR